MCTTAAPDRPTTTRQMTSVNTVETSVPVRPEPPRSTPLRAPLRRRRWWPVPAGVAVAASVGVGAAVVPLPLLAISPGSVVDVAGLVSVEHPEVVDGNGRFYLTTVRLSPVTVLGAVQAWIRPEVDVVGRDAVMPAGVDADGLRQLNLDQMSASKRQALGVAFEALGYDAVSGDGAEVVDLSPEGPASQVLRPGDLIVGLAGTAVTSHHDVLRLLAEQRPGRRVQLDIHPADGPAPRTVEVVLAHDREAPDRAQLGAILRTRRPRFDFPVDVDIHTDRIGGSSAGLAFALEALDALTEGDLTRGRRVAATGTIELDGSVGEVGGVAQKVAALEHHRIDVLLVPEPELDRAKALAGPGVRVEPVNDLGDALRVLAEGGGVTPPRRW